MHSKQAPNNIPLILPAGAKGKQQPREKIVNIIFKIIPNF